MGVASRSLNLRTLKVLFAAFAMVLVMMIPRTTPVQCAENPALEVSVLNVINQQRVAIGLKPLTWNAQLAADATVRANEAAVKFSHTRPNGKQWYTVDPARMYGENLANNYFNEHSLVYAWLTSPTHLANLIGNYKSAGVAVHYVTPTKCYWAIEFGY